MNCWKDINDLFMNDFALAASFLKRRLLDQRHIRRSAWHELIKETQINRQVPLFRDRELELKDFFRLSTQDLWKLYLSRGFPNTKRFKCFLDVFFDGRTDPANLKYAYENAAFYYTLRLMLAFERYTMITPYLNRLFSLFKMKNSSLTGIRVLEYGCGISDIGLLCNLLGAEVTICDLSDTKLNFAEWRHRKRERVVSVIHVYNCEQIPDLGKERYDLIIATEVFEHVRNPLALLRTLTASLQPGGVLFDSMGGRFDREPRGDHLAEALKIGDSDEYKTYYGQHYGQPYKNEGLPYLFRKN